MSAPRFFYFTRDGFFRGHYVRYVRRDGTQFVNLTDILRMSHRSQTKHLLNMGARSSPMVAPAVAKLLNTWTGFFSAASIKVGQARYVRMDELATLCELIDAREFPLAMYLDGETEELALLVAKP